MSYRVTLDRRATLRLVGATCIISALKACTYANIFEEAGEGFTFDLSDPQFSALGEVGQSVGIDTGGRQVLLIRRSEEEVIALNRKCTHAGYDLAPEEFGLWKDDQLTCKGHFSVFSHTGAVISGLATAPLASYDVSFNEGAGTGEVNFLSGGAPVGGESGGAAAGGAGGGDIGGGGGAGGGGVAGGEEGGVMGGAPGEVPAEYRDLMNPYAGDPQAVTDGEVEYASCAGCHGAAGVGGPTLMPPASAFNVDQSEWSDGYLFWIIKEGGGGSGGLIDPSMPGFGSFTSDEQIWKIVSYIRSLAL